LHAQAPAAPPAQGNPLLQPSAAAARMTLLAELQAALDGLGIRCVLARCHRLVLRYTADPVPPSGLTDPSLHILGPAGPRTARTDGLTYQLDTGQKLPVSDPAGAAAAIRTTQIAGRASSRPPA